MATPIVNNAQKSINTISADSNLVSGHLLSNVSRLTETGTVTSEKRNKPPIPIKKVNVNLTIGPDPPSRRQSPARVNPRA